MTKQTNRRSDAFFGSELSHSEGYDGVHVQTMPTKIAHYIAQSKLLFRFFDALSQREAAAGRGMR